MLEIDYPNKCPCNHSQEDPCLRDKIAQLIANKHVIIQILNAAQLCSENVDCLLLEALAKSNSSVETVINGVCIQKQGVQITITKSNEKA